MAEVPASPIPPGDSRLCDEPRRPGPGSAAANGNQSVKALVYVAAFAPEKAVMLLRIGPRQVYLRGMVWLSVTALWHIGCMRSQVITIMAPEDEAAFLRFVFERPTVYLIPDERNSTPEIPHTRDVRGIRSMHCMLWDKAILPRPQVEHIPSRNDYHLRSAESLIQFLRSRLKEDSILAGRIALSTGRRGGPDTNPKTARAMTAWYNALGRWIKSTFKNSFVYASDFKPNVGSRERQVWVGPRAIEMSLQGVKLKQDGPPEYSLHYFDPATEDSVLAGYREPEMFIGIGRVVHVGDVVSPTMREHIFFRITMEKDAPFSEFEGTFRRVGPEPRLGDEVACVFSENIFGRHAEPWEPREIKKLTAVNRERVLEGIRKAWRV